MNTTIPLGEIVEIRGGGTPSRSVEAYWGGPIPWATVKDFKSTCLDATLESITPEGVVNSSTNIIPSGAIIVPTRMAVGKAAINSVDLAINQDLKALLPRENIDQKFLLHFLLSKARFLEDRAQGATVKGIKLDLLRSLEFPNLSFEEQRRIAGILDKADGIRRKREQALKFADRFLRSVFEQIFDDLQNNPKGWDTALLLDILSFDPQNGLYRPSKDYGSGTYILRIDSFYDGYLIKDRPLKQLSIDQKTIAKYLLCNGDIVINRVNSREYLGKSALIEGLTEKTVFESNMMRLRVQEHVAAPRFLVDQLQTQFIKGQILRASKDAVNQSSINQTDVKNLEVRLPPIDLQSKYAEVVAKKNSSDHMLYEALAAANELFEGLSQRAFRGEL